MKCWMNSNNLAFKFRASSSRIGTVEDHVVRLFRIDDEFNRLTTFGYVFRLPRYLDAGLYQGNERLLTWTD